DDLQDAFPAVHIDMKFRRPIQSASLRFALIGDQDELLESGQREWVEKVVKEEIVEEIGIPEDFFFEFCPPKLLGPPRRRKTLVGDRVEEITIGYRTLSAIGKLLRRNG